MRIAPETIRAWPLPARPALSLARRTLGLTARRFVDFGRTESMMCPATLPDPLARSLPAWQSSPKPPDRLVLLPRARTPT